MSNLDATEVNALISLLDDTDEEVVQHVTTRLLSYGEEVLPLLEDRFLAEQEKQVQDRIHQVIDRIYQNNLHRGLVEWAKGGGKDLFEGIFLISKYRYPELNKQQLNNQIDKIKLEAWLELNFQLSTMDKVRILNYILFDIHGFKGNADDYHSPDNSYINRVLETRKGNPISLAILYSIIAQRLSIPIFGVNLPQHFVLCYKDEMHLKTHPGQRNSLYLEHDMPGEVLFYINPFNKGAVFSKWNIDQFLKQLNVSPHPFYYEPCSNVDILVRVCRNLKYSYEKKGDERRMNGVQAMLDLLQPYGSWL